MSSSSRDDRREGSLWRSLSAEEAAGVLIESHEGQAGEEALFMALLAERDMQHDRAAFWITVYAEIRGERVDGVN